MKNNKKIRFTSRNKWLALIVTSFLLIGLMPLLATGNTTDECYYEDSMILYGGQNIPVGMVYVENDGEYLYVTYKITEEDWYLTETHVHVGENLEDFPRAGRWGNPVPGQFDYHAYFDLEDEVIEYTEIIELGEWEPCNDILIGAHAVVMKVECETMAEAPYGGSNVVDNNQGLRYDYTDVKSQRSNPNTTLTFETGQNEANFFSLGFAEDREEYTDVDDAWIIIEFDYPILNGEGDDLQVIEDTWGLPYPNETADVWVSQDGIDWFYLGMADNQNPISQYHTVTNFDLEDVGLDYASFVKVQDTSNREDFAHLYPGQSATLDGYDLNAVVALQDHIVCETYDETAWADGCRFTEKGNWGTYFKYHIQETCVEYCVNFCPIEPGNSVEGFGTVNEYLNIQTPDGNAVKVMEGETPRVYGADNIDLDTNKGIDIEKGGFSDITAKNSVAAHNYIFSFSVPITNFTLRMLDFGDYNPSRSTYHYANMTAYNGDDDVVDLMELEYNSDGQVNPRDSDYGDLWYTGDAVDAEEGEPGNWIWTVSGTDIVTIELYFGEGYDPNIAFDNLCFTICE
ncbi:MAG: hypothetical protein ACOC87_00865 [Candidatus Natronoplasma sp.]